MKYSHFTAIFLVTGCGWFAKAPSNEDSSGRKNEGTPSASIEKLNRTEYQKTFAGAQGVEAPLSLCELVTKNRWSAAGLYMVDSIVGYSEPVTGPDTPTGYAPFTYVELSLVDAWSPGAPSKPVARITGGPSRDGRLTAAWYVSLKVGEPVGLLLSKPLPANLDFPTLQSQGTFNLRSDGGFSNELLFTQSRVDDGELGSLVRGLWNGGGGEGGVCPYDVAPDYGTGPQTVQPHPKPGFEVGAEDAGNK